MTARALMVQGTASSAGKSILVTALCRIFRQDGHSVAPFKAQNMALNSYVTSEGGEIGRSQAVQAWAAGIAPSIDMNPVLLKPQADNCSQLIVRGKATGTADASSYYHNNKRLLPVIRKSYNSLAAQYEMIVIEGAGSPAEINLMSKEIANMRIAEMAGSPVLLVGDIDRGGVFASLAGTMLLLPPRWRKLVKGFVINKFRGDISLLKPGLDFLEKRYSIPVLGVIPYFRGLQIAQEDSVYLDERPNGKREGLPDICVIRLPRISNYDDFDPLEQSCNVRYITSVNELGDPDLIILPGTKSTMADMGFLLQSGLAGKIVARAKAGTPVIGICGGYQMLGKSIYDGGKAESGSQKCRGLGLLDAETVFEPAKITTQVKAAVNAGPGLLQGMENVTVAGYEIHMGRDRKIPASPAFNIIKPDNSPLADGAVNKKGTVFGTYIHGLFDNADFTGRLIENICTMRGLAGVSHQAIDREKSYDELAAVVRKNIDMHKIYEIIAGGRDGRE
jgi:adenosylcobyric acid synthase